MKATKSVVTIGFGKETHSMAFGKVSVGFRWSQEGHQTGVTLWEIASFGGESTPTEEQFAVVDRCNFLSGISKKEASVGTNFFMVVVVQ